MGSERFVTCKTRLLGAHYQACVPTGIKRSRGSRSVYLMIFRQRISHVNLTLTIPTKRWTSSIGICKTTSDQRHYGVLVRTSHTESSSSV